MPGDHDAGSTSGSLAPGSLRIQGTGSLAITARANSEIWLENRNGIIMRLNAAQAGPTFSQGRYELTIQLSR